MQLVGDTSRRPSLGMDEAKMIEGAAITVRRLIEDRLPPGSAQRAIALAWLEAVLSVRRQALKRKRPAGAGPARG